MDISFLFWAIAGGIVLGAGLIPLALIGSLLIGIIILIFSRIKTTDIPYILLINLDGNCNEAKVADIISQSTKKNVLKSKTVNQSVTQLAYEVKINGNDSDFINRICHTDGVCDATLVSYNGEYMA